MKTSDFYFDLPKEQIAQDPLEDRSASRLLVMDRETGAWKHDVFKHITDYLKPGDCLVLNNTKVIPARLYGVREGTGAAIEILLLRRKENDTWETLVKPGKKARPGTKIIFGDGILTGEVTDVVEDGNRLIRFSYEGIFEEILDALGQMPLPPYITHELKDKNRYQTVYAKYDGSAAAPTAGLHFTPELLDEVRDMGVDIAEITLHVGLGTFRPVKEEEITDHHMHSEYFVIDEEAADKINLARESGGRIICVGTTSCRTLESAARGCCRSDAQESCEPDTLEIVTDSAQTGCGTDADENSSAAGESGSCVLEESASKNFCGESGRMIKPCSGWTDIFIYPGYRFLMTDGLITNFHLPESTLLMLVSAFAGRENILAAYEEAVREGYRFFSFGDVTFLTDDIGNG